MEQAVLGYAYIVAVIATIGGIILLYLLPAIIADERKHRNRTAILVLNILAGWTTIGWIIALIWAMTSNRRI